MKPAVWLIGGGPLARRVPGWARACGLAPIVANRDPRAPGFEDAAERVVLDATDADAHVAAARALAGRYAIRGVYCGGEHGLETARRVAESLGLAAPPRDALSAALDKARAKAAFRAAGVATPEGGVVAGAGELAALLEASAGGRVVVKPAGGSGSRGVRVVARGDDLERALAECGAAAPGAIVAEPYLEGRSIDANGCFLDGRYVACGTLEKFETPFPERLPLGGEDPARVAPDVEARVHALLEQGARALGIEHGPVKGDLILTARGPVLLEVAPRFHGDVTSASTLPFGSGVSPYHLWFRWLADRRADPSAPEPGLGHGAWRVILAPPGRVVRREAPRAAGDVTLIWHNPRTAHAIPRYADTTRIPGYACARGADRRAAEEALAAALAGGGGIEVEPDPAHLAWHRSLARALRAAGLDPAASGHRG